MKPGRFRALTLIATMGVSAGCGGPSDVPEVTRSAAIPDILSGITTPGQAYMRELTIGAADGMRSRGWFDAETEARVSRAREEAALFRFDMRPDVEARYDEVRATGYKQGESGEWDRDALNGYLDVIEAGNVRFLAIEGAGLSDYAWSTPLEAIAEVTGAKYGPLNPDRHGHAVVATALASEINEGASRMARLIEETGEHRVPAVELGQWFMLGWDGPREAFTAFAEILPVNMETSSFETDKPDF